MSIYSTAATLYRVFCLVATIIETSCIMWLSTTTKRVIVQPLKSKAISVQEVEVPRISRQLEREGGMVVSLAHWPPLPSQEIIISVRGPVNPRANDTIRSQNNAVPRPTVSMCAPISALTSYNNYQPSCNKTCIWTSQLKSHIKTK